MDYYNTYAVCSVSIITKEYFKQHLFIVNWQYKTNNHKIKFFVVFKKINNTIKNVNACHHP